LGRVQFEIAYEIRKKIFFFLFYEIENRLLYSLYHLKGVARLEDRSYFGSSQTPARLFCFMQSFNNFSLIYVQINQNKPFELN